METILISLISEQTIPNIIAIKECSSLNVRNIFITTKEMEKDNKSQCIEEAVGIIKGSTERIIIDENSINNIINVLNNYFLASEKRYLINITGGTKLISMTVYNYFKNLSPFSQFIYLPINQGIIQHFGQDEKMIPIKIRLTIKEYLMAYGISIISYKNSNYGYAKAQEVFEEYKKCGFNNICERWKKYSKNNKYLNGDWFEDYCYYNLKLKYSLSDSHIMTNVKISHCPTSPNHENEFDIMFVLNNELYVFECKYSLNRNQYLKEKTDNTIYKLGAITRNFGLKTNSYIITLTDFDKINNFAFNNFKNKCNLLKIKKLIYLAHFNKNCAFNL